MLRMSVTNQDNPNALRFFCCRGINSWNICEDLVSLYFLPNQIGVFAGIVGRFQSRFGRKLFSISCQFCDLFIPKCINILIVTIAGIATVVAIGFVLLLLPRKKTPRRCHWHLLTKICSFFLFNCFL